MILIIARCRQHAEHFAYEHRLKRRQWVYYNYAQDLIGLDLNRFTPVRLPGYWENPQAEAFDKVIDEWEAKYHGS